MQCVTQMCYSADLDTVDRPLTSLMFLGRSGAGGRTRTDDLLITNQLLYQLSYAGAAGQVLQTT